jgi:hypothetical protein
MMHQLHHFLGNHGHENNYTITARSLTHELIQLMGNTLSGSMETHNEFTTQMTYDEAYGAGRILNNV